MSNGSLWNTLSLVISLDNHTEASSLDLAAPSDYSFNNEQTNKGNSEKSGIANIYQIGLLVLITAGLFVSRKKS